MNESRSGEDGELSKELTAILDHKLLNYVGGLIAQARIEGEATGYERALDDLEEVINNTPVDKNNMEYFILLHRQELDHLKQGRGE